MFLKYPLTKTLAEVVDESDPIVTAVAITIAAIFFTIFSCYVIRAFCPIKINKTIFCFFVTNIKGSKPSEEDLLLSDKFKSA